MARRMRCGRMDGRDGMRRCCHRDSLHDERLEFGLRSVRQSELQASRALTSKASDMSVATFLDGELRLC